MSRGRSGSRASSARRPRPKTSTLSSSTATTSTTTRRLTKCSLNWRSAASKSRPKKTHCATAPLVPKERTNAPWSSFIRRIYGATRTAGCACSWSSGSVRSASSAVTGSSTRGIVGTIGSPGVVPASSALHFCPALLSSGFCPLSSHRKRCEDIFCYTKRGSRRICRRSRFAAAEPSILQPGTAKITVDAGATVDIQNEDTWRTVLGHYDAEYDTARRVLNGRWCPENRMTETGGIVRTWSDPNGKLNVLVVNWNGSQRKLNCNWFDNTWNRQNYRFAGRRPRNSLHFSPRSGGVEFFSSCPCHPPSILPISSTGSDSAAYFLLSSDLLSQRMRSRSFIVSNLRIAIRRYGNFSVFGKKAAADTISITSTNNVSTFAPTVY